MVEVSEMRTRRLSLEERKNQMNSRELANQLIPTAEGRLPPASS